MHSLNTKIPISDNKKKTPRYPLSVGLTTMSKHSTLLPRPRRLCCSECHFVRDHPDFKRTFYRSNWQSPLPYFRAPDCVDNCSSHAGCFLICPLNSATRGQAPPLTQALSQQWPSRGMGGRRRAEKGIKTPGGSSTQPTEDATNKRGGFGVYPLDRRMERKTSVTERK